MDVRSYKPQEILNTNSRLVHFSREEVYFFPQILEGIKMPLKNVKTVP